MKRIIIATLAAAALTVGYADVSLGGGPTIDSCVFNPPCPAALEAERERQRRAKELREEEERLWAELANDEPQAAIEEPPLPEEPPQAEESQLAEIEEVKAIAEQITQRLKQLNEAAGWREPESNAEPKDCRDLPSHEERMQCIQGVNEAAERVVANAEHTRKAEEARRERREQERREQGCRDLGSFDERMRCYGELMAIAKQITCEAAELQQAAANTTGP